MRSEGPPIDYHASCCNVNSVGNWRARSQGSLGSEASTGKRGEQRRLTARPSMYKVYKKRYIKEIAYKGRTRDKESGRGTTEKYADNIWGKEINY